MIDKEVIKSVVEKILKMDYGETVPHYMMATDLGVKYGSRDYAFSVCKVRNQLLERGKYLENIFKVGYRVTYPDDYSGQALRQYGQATRRIKKGQKILDHAPTEHMTQSGLAQYRSIKDRSSALAAHMSGAVVELRLLQKQHPLKQAK